MQNITYCILYFLEKVIAKQLSLEQKEKPISINSGSGSSGE